MLSEVERLVFKSIGEAIKKDKDNAIDIMVNAVNTAVDADTSLECLSLMEFSESIFKSVLWRLCPTVEFYCEGLRGSKQRFHREFMEVFGWE